MPPRAGSRYGFCLGIRDEAGHTFLTDREPYGFHPHADNRVHVVVQGDTLYDLAGRYFEPLPRACGFWWVIADFQPEVIIDPTLEIGPSGKRIWVPSVRVLTDVILGESRRRQVG
jgi:hypothetical protein